MGSSCTKLTHDAESQTTNALTNCRTVLVGPADCPVDGTHETCEIAPNDDASLQVSASVGVGGNPLEGDMMLCDVHSVDGEAQSPGGNNDDVATLWNTEAAFQTYGAERSAISERPGSMVESVGERLEKLWQSISDVSGTRQGMSTTDVGMSSTESMGSGCRSSNPLTHVKFVFGGEKGSTGERSRSTSPWSVQQQSSDESSQGQRRSILKKASRVP